MQANSMENVKLSLFLTNGAYWRLFACTLATLALVRLLGTDVGSLLAALLLLGGLLLKAVPLQEAVFLALCFGMVVGGKDFAYLHLQLGEAPLYITELSLGLIIFSLFLKRFAGAGFPLRFRWIDFPLFLFWLAGIYAISRGSGSPLLTLRDFAIVYYSLFLWLARAIFQSLSQIYRLFRVILLGAIVTAEGAFVNYAFHREIDPTSALYNVALGRFMHGFMGTFIVVALVVLFACWRTLPDKLVWLGVFCFLGASLALTQQRSIFLSVVVGFVFMAFLGRKDRLVVWTPILATLSVGLFAASLYAFADVSSDFLAKTSERLYSGFFKFGSDPTVSFRFDTWREAWSRFVRDPVRGEGFGIPFVFFYGIGGGYILEDVRPHNTFLTVLYKMGLVGFLPFVATMGAFYVFLLRAYRAAKVEKPCLLSLGGAHVALLVLGNFNLFLESPFQSFLFWTLMGLAYAATRRPAPTPKAAA